MAPFKKNYLYIFLKGLLLMTRDEYTLVLMKQRICINHLSLYLTIKLTMKHKMCNLCTRENTPTFWLHFLNVKFYILECNYAVTPNLNLRCKHILFSFFKNKSNIYCTISSKINVINHCLKLQHEHSNNLDTSFLKTKNIKLLLC